MKTLVYYNVLADTIQFFTFKNDEVRIEYKCVDSEEIVDRVSQNIGNYYNNWLNVSGLMEYLGEL